MASSSLFIGMVTHARSRFNADDAAARLAVSLASAVHDLGIDTEVLVSDRNDYDDRALPLTRTGLVVSAAHQAGLEHRWRRYLAAGGAPARWRAFDVAVWAGMAGKRAVVSIGRNPAADVSSMPGARAATRLLNIDLSHLRIMDRALASGSPWTLVLEDDAGIADVGVVAGQVAGLMRLLGPTGVAFASLSESLPLDELGVEGLLRPAVDIAVPDGLGFSLLRASRPITNTVCATLYRADYLSRLHGCIVDRGLVPIAPIDWRVNEAIMDLFDRGLLDEQSCVWTSPGIVLQRSMHDPA